MCAVEMEDEDDEDEDPGYESPLRFAERRVEEGTNNAGTEGAELAQRIESVESLVASGGLALRNANQIGLVIFD